MSEPGTHALGVSLQGYGCGGPHVEGLTQCGVTLVDCLDETLRHIVRMDVMHRFHPEVRELDWFPLQKLGEDGGIEVAGGIDRRPASPHQMAGMQHSYREFA